MRPIRRTALAMLALATLAIAGCQSPTNPTTAPATTPPTRATLPDGQAWPTGPRTTSGTGGLLVAIRAARHQGFDRMVFEFAEGMPPATVRYVPQVLEDPRGGVVPLRGHAFLQVTFKHASAVDLRTNPPRQTYTGPTVLTPGLPSLVQLRLAGDFEAVLSFGVGLDHRVGFRVFTLRGPWRLVVDVSHQHE